MLIFPGKGTHQTWAIGRTGARFEGWKAPPRAPGGTPQPHVPGVKVEPRKRHVSAVRVGDGVLRGSLDGKQLVEWRSDGTDFEGMSIWKMNDPTRLGLGAYSMDVVVHSARLTYPPVGKDGPPR